MDIAGFGKDYFKTVFEHQSELSLIFNVENLVAEDGSFDQLSINYINERFQQFFVKQMLLNEEDWYKSQGIKERFVPFFNNTHIIGMYYLFCSMWYVFLRVLCK